MKYLRWLWTVVKKPVGKVVGVVYTPLVAWWFRAYATNVVFNYVIKNDVYLPRVDEVKKSKLGSFEFEGQKILGYEFYGDGKTVGYLRYRDVSKLEYFLVYKFLWQWLDCDNTSDLTALGYGRDILKGVHYTWFPEWIVSRVEKEQKRCEDGLQGNAWQLGDRRYDNKISAPLLGFLWNLRNSYYNANYMEEECKPGSKNWWYVEVPSRGWHFGYLPAESKRPGRLVWFTEDYDKR